MICPNCKNENKNTNIRCEYCSYELNPESELSEVEYVSKEIQVSTKKVGFLSNIIFIIFLGPFLLAGIVLLYIGLSNNLKTKGYEHTTAFFKDYIKKLQFNFLTAGLCRFTLGKNKAGGIC